MDLDPDIAHWVLDFYLRQPLEDRTLNSLLRALPFPSDNPNLQKLFLLKKLESEVSLRPVSEIALELMERLEDLEFRQGNEKVSDAMRRAYCAVAVDCTLKFVKVGHVGGDNASKYEFFEMVKRLWRERIGRMQKTAGERGLGSELLWEWKDMIETAVWDDRAGQSVLKKFEGISAVEAVRVYVREEREKMGPSFLELVSETMKNDEGLRTILGVHVIAPVAVKDQAASFVVPDASGSNPRKEMHKRKNKLRDKRVGGMPSRNSRGAKIVNLDETAGGPSCRNDSSPRSAQVNKAREALKLSSLELRAAVKDPLPDALRVAEAISNEARQDKQHNSSGGNDGRPESFIVDAAGVVHSNDGTVNNVPKPSLMERNSSARTNEWDESIDGSQEDVAGRALLRVPSPKKISTSPLRIYEINNLKKRRKGRRWTHLEEDTLRAGVETHGKGNWKLILTTHRDIFEGRTEVDLKDKWRNLTRY